MGSTNRSKTSYVAEVTAGTTPASPAFKELRVTSNTLVMNPTRTITNEIRSDRQVSDQILVDLNNSGATGIELSFHAHDDLIEAAFQGTWADKPSITVVASDTEISDVAATTLTVSAGGAAFLAGNLVLTTGFTTAANNNIISVVSSSGTTSVVFPALTFAVEAAVIPVGACARVVGFSGASGDIVAVTAGGNALTSTTISFTTLSLNVGEWVKVGGDTAGSQFATAANNSWCKISAITAHRLSFGVVPASWTADAGTSKTIQLFYGDYVKNGTTTRSFTIERQQQDLTAPSYEYFTGDQVDTLSVQFKSAAIITGSCGWLGLTGTASTSRFTAATDISPPAYSVLNAASNVGRFLIGGTLVSTPSYITDISIDLKNNLARQTAVSVLGAVGVSDFELAVSGNISAYFGDLTMLNNVLNDSETSIMLRSGRSDGNRESIIFHVERVKVTGSAPVNAKNQDRMFTGTYAAKLDTSYGTISAGRFWYLPVAV